MMDGLMIHGFTVTSLIVHFILLLLAVFQESNAKMKNPRFIDTTENVTEFVGETAVLPCAVRHLGTKEVIWKKISQRFPLTIGDFVYTADSSYSIEHDKKKNRWNLVIKNVQKLHMGIYECQISTKEDLRRNVTLNVLDAKPKKDSHDIDKKAQKTPHKPGSRKHKKHRKKQKHRKKSAIHIKGPRFVEGGSEIKLTCNATGKDFPPEDVDWFKDGLKIKGDSAHEIYVTKFRQSETRTLISELIIRHSELEDTGTYICRSSDLEIISHNLMVLNSESNQNKRGTQPEIKNHGSVLPNSGVEKPGNGFKTIHNTHINTMLTALIPFIICLKIC